MTTILAVVAACLFGSGTYLILQRTLTRIVFGLALIGHATNLLLVLSAGRAENPPLIGTESPPYADPLPQAMALTAIVINFAVVVFVLTLAYRSYRLTRADEVEDDAEDRRLRRRLAEEVERGVDADAEEGGEFDEDELMEVLGAGRQAVGIARDADTGQRRVQRRRPGTKPDDTGAQKDET